jgi:hypothetical protein
MYARQKNVKGAISCYEKDLNLITYPIHNSTYTVISDNSNSTGNISDSVRTDVSTDAAEITNSTDITDKDSESAGTLNPLTSSEKLKITSIHLKLGSLYNSSPLTDVISAAFHYDTALDMGAEMDKNLRIFYARNSKVLYENSLKNEGMVQLNNDGNGSRSNSTETARNSSEIDSRGFEESSRGLDGRKKSNESLLARAQRLFLEESGMYMYLYLYIYVYIHIYTYIYIHIYVYVYIFERIYTHINTYIYIYE